VVSARQRRALSARDPLKGGPGHASRIVEMFDVGWAARYVSFGQHFAPPDLAEKGRERDSAAGDISVGRFSSPRI
jgi:hypothetical protein